MVDMASPPSRPLSPFPGYGHRSGASEAAFLFRNPIISHWDLKHTNIRLALIFSQGIKKSPLHKGEGENATLDHCRCPLIRPSATFSLREKEPADDQSSIGYQYNLKLLNALQRAFRQLSPCSAAALPPWSALPRPDAGLSSPPPRRPTRPHPAAAFCLPMKFRR